MWETHAYPGVGSYPQDVINEQIGDDYDIFIGIMWERFGTPTRRAQSGTEEEFDRVYKRFEEDPKQIRIMIYFKDSRITDRKSKSDPLMKIKEFREKLGEKGVLWWSFSDLDNFAGLIRLHLSRQLQGWQRTWGVPRSHTVMLEQDEIKSMIESSIVGAEEGVSELLDHSTEGVTTLGRVVERMRIALVDLIDGLQRRTTEMTKAATLQDRVLIKRSNDRAAENMEQFVILIKADIKVFTKSYKYAFGVLGRLAVLLVGSSGEDKQNIQTLLHTTRDFRSTLGETRSSLVDFRAAVAQLSPDSTRITRARDTTTNMLADLVQELTAAIDLIAEGEKALEQIVMH